MSIDGVKIVFKFDQSAEHRFHELSNEGLLALEQVVQVRKGNWSTNTVEEDKHAGLKQINSHLTEWKFILNIQWNNQHG